MVVVNADSSVCYCYYIDVNHALLLSAGKQREKREKLFFAQQLWRRLEEMLVEDTFLFSFPFLSSHLLFKQLRSQRKLSPYKMLDVSYLKKK